MWKRNLAVTFTLFRFDGRYNIFLLSLDYYHVIHWCKLIAQNLDSNSIFRCVFSLSKSLINFLDSLSCFSKVYKNKTNDKLMTNPPTQSYNVLKHYWILLTGSLRQHRVWEDKKSNFFFPYQNGTARKLSPFRCNPRVTCMWPCILSNRM